MKKRLLKKADEQNTLETEKEIDLDAVEIVLNEIDQSIDQLYESYVKLFENLNSLYKEYPKLYDAMKLVIRFPDERDAEKIAEMKSDFQDLREHYKDKNYLSDILDLYNENE